MKFHFVIPEDRRLAAVPRDQWSLETLNELFCDGPFAWGLQTYLRLRDAGASDSLSCSTDVVSGAINLAHSSLVDFPAFDQDVFIVCLQADYVRKDWCPAHIVQNQSRQGSDALWVPHWAQYGLVPRDSSRGEEFSRVGYFGRPNSADTSELAWQNLLDPLGMEVHFPEASAAGWSDYSGVDVCVGHRGFDGRSYDGKPPTKLLNAWRAGVPFVSGGDSASRQIGEVGVDFVEALTTEDVVSALQQLKQNPQRVKELVERGQRKAEQFTDQAITECWRVAMRQIAEEIYPAWLANREDRVEQARRSYRSFRRRQRVSSALGGVLQKVGAAGLVSEARRRWKL